MNRMTATVTKSDNLAADGATPAQPVLLASTREEDARDLATLLPGETWMLVRVATWRDALKVIGSVIIPVILCDRDLPGLEGPGGLAGLRGNSRFPALLLLSDITRSTLFDDVVKFGAFDVLSRPLSRETLIPTLDFARIYWEMRSYARPAIPESRV